MIDIVFIISICHRWSWTHNVINQKMKWMNNNMKEMKNKQYKNKHKIHRHHMTKKRRRRRKNEISSILYLVYCIYISRTTGNSSSKLLLTWFSSMAKIELAFINIRFVCSSSFQEYPTNSYHWANFLRNDIFQWRPNGSTNWRYWH